MSVSSYYMNINYVYKLFCPLACSNKIYLDSIFLIMFKKMQISAFLGKITPTCSTSKNKRRTSYNKIDTQKCCANKIITKAFRSVRYKDRFPFRVSFVLINTALVWVVRKVISFFSFKRRWWYF